MTTIACSRTEMACDSRTSASEIYFTTTDKVIRIRDCLVGSSGNLDSVAKFIDWFTKGGHGEPIDFDDGDDFESIVLHKSGIYIYSNSCRPRRIVGKFCSTGSGDMAALAAMLCGKTPAEAVAIAIKCDKNSGPPVRNFTL